MSTEAAHAPVATPAPVEAFLAHLAGERQVSGAGNAMVTGIGVIPYARNWGSSSVLILEA